MSNHIAPEANPDLLVVQRLGLSTELSQDIAECSHAFPRLSHLVLRHSVLDMREDKVFVEVGRSLVVLDGLVESVGDKVDYITHGQRYLDAAISKRNLR